MGKNINEGEKMSAKKEKPKKITYAEPADYFPKSIRKKYGLGEYCEQEPETGEKYGQNGRKSG